jgi:hypothetical protein
MGGSGSQLVRNEICIQNILQKPEMKRKPGKCKGSGNILRCVKVMTFFSLQFPQSSSYFIALNKVKSKAIPVTGRGGP